jgi:VanZ family protein
VSQPEEAGTPRTVPVRRTRWVSRWAATMLWAGVILALGSSHFSMRRTAVVIEPLLLRLAPNASDNTIAHWHDLARWSSHFAEYGMLALVLIWRPLRGRPLLVLLLCLALALLDEGLQALNPARSGDFFDVSLDFAGAVAVIALGLPSWASARRGA